LSLPCTKYWARLLSLDITLSSQVELFLKKEQTEEDKILGIGSLELNILHLISKPVYQSLLFFVFIILAEIGRYFW
jgi:hypothetical protein